MKMEAETTKSPAGSDSSSLDTCGICKELFHSRDPKLLPCLHSFCRSCIVPKANENGLVQCPMCQAESKLGDMVDWLCISRDRGLGAVGAGGTGNGTGDGSAQEEVHICTGCEENAAASSYCTDCPEWLCDQCVQAHRRVRVTKDHTIEPKENVINRPNSASSSSSSTTSSSAHAILFCPQHLHEPLKLFCETCDKLTCRDCQLGEHKDHRYQFVNEASTQYKQFLQILLTKIKEKQTYIENAYQLIHKRHQEIEEREKVVLNDIKAFAKRLMSEVNNRGKQLVTDLHLICTAKKAQLGYKQKAIVTLSGQLEHSLLMAEKILDCNNTAAMLSSKKLLVQHLKHLLRTRCEVPNPYHVVDINLQYNEDVICGHLAKQGTLIVDGVTYRGPRKPTSTAPQSASSTGQGLQSTARPLQSIAPKIVGPPPNITNLSVEHQTALLKSIAGQQMNQGQGSNSPTSTMATPRFPGSIRSMAPVATLSQNSSNGSKPNSKPAKTFHPFMQVPQSNTVSSTQVVRTGSVYYPPSGPSAIQKQQQQPGGPRRTPTVQQQLMHQRQRLQEKQQQQQTMHHQHQQHQQLRYHQHQHQMSIKQQMDKLAQEIQRQHNMGGSSTPGTTLIGSSGVPSTQKSRFQPPMMGQSGSRGAGMGNPSMANAIIIQPASSTGHYQGISSSTQLGNGRDQLTPSPNLRTSPLSQGSRNGVSPVGSLNDGLGSTSDSKQSDSIFMSGLVKQEQLIDMYSQMIGPDGALCIKPEPPTPDVDPAPLLPYPKDLNYDDAFIRSMHEKPIDLQNSELLESGVGTSSSQSVSNQDQAYNLCKPITDQVICCQPDGNAPEVLDLSRNAGGDTEWDSSTGEQILLGTVTPASEVPGYSVLCESEVIPRRDPDDPSEDYCAVCQNGGELLCCDTCPKVFHLNCHVPSLTTEPSGTWSCGLCVREHELKIEEPMARPTDVTGSKRKMSTERLVDRELKVCQRILLELFCHKASPLFHEPVPKSVPNYHKIISTPMDLGTIKSKLARTHGPRYITIDDFLGDIQLVFSNCNLFNDSESAVGKAGKIAEGFFHSIVNKYLPYFHAWTAAPHEFTATAEPKVKRRKTYGKDAKEARGVKVQHAKGEKTRGKSPIPHGKANRKTPDKNSDHTESDLVLVTNEDMMVDNSDMNVSYQEESTEDAMIRNLGLIRQHCEQIAPTLTEPQDLPSDPVNDPNDDQLDSSLGLIETDEIMPAAIVADSDTSSKKVCSDIDKVSGSEVGVSKSDENQAKLDLDKMDKSEGKEYTKVENPVTDDNEPHEELNDISENVVIRDEVKKTDELDRKDNDGKISDSKEDEHAGDGNSKTKEGGECDSGAVNETDSTALTGAIIEPLKENVHNEMEGAPAGLETCNDGSDGEKSDAKVGSVKTK